MSGVPPVPGTDSLAARLRRIAGSRTARDTLTNAAGTVTAAGLGFAALLLTTNTMGAASYGLFALALTVLTMTAELADMGVNAGMIRHASAHLGRGDRSAAHGVLSAALRMKLVTALAGGLLVAATAGPVARALGRPEAAPLVRIAALGLAGAVLLGLTSAVLQAHQRFARNAVLGACHWGVRLLGTGVLVISGNLDPVRLLWLYAASPWLLFLLGLALIPRGSLSWRRWDRDRAREVIHFGRWLALWALFSILLNRVDLLLLAALSVDAEVGYYAASRRVTLLVTLLANAYLMTLIPHLSRLADRAALQRALRHARFVSLAVAAGILLVLVPLSPWLVRAFGPEFSAGGGVLALLLVGTLFHALTLPYNSALYALNRPQAFALASGLGLALSLAGNLWLIPRYGARGAAATAAVVGFELLVVAFLAYRRALARPDAAHLHAETE